MTSNAESDASGPRAVLNNLKDENPIICVISMVITAFLSILIPNLFHYSVNSAKKIEGMRTYLLNCDKL
jgi:hypothetical protein